uniref:Uncharacterized protein n=2 Tax=Aegilops tauschii subsp. strangulata TaxID=200361 RepID=A0A453M4S5_AEGTS
TILSLHELLHPSNGSSFYGRRAMSWCFKCLVSSSCWINELVIVMLDMVRWHKVWLWICKVAVGVGLSSWNFV